MNNGKTRAVVRICGDEYIIRETLRKSTSSIWHPLSMRRCGSCRPLTRISPRHKLALLVAINLADELERLRNENKELMELIGEVK